MLKAKIHRVRVTSKDLNYEGSLSLDEELMELSGLLPFERVEVYNITNGNRFSTYVIPSKVKGEVCLNGASARLGEVGDLLIITSYALYTEEELKNYEPRIILVDEKNRPKLKVAQT